MLRRKEVPEIQSVPATLCHGGEASRDSSQWKPRGSHVSPTRNGAGEPGEPWAGMLRATSVPKRTTCGLHLACTKSRTSLTHLRKTITTRPRGIFFPPQTAGCYPSHRIARHSRTAGCRPTMAAWHTVTTSKPTAVVNPCDQRPLFQNKGCILWVSWLWACFAQPPQKDLQSDEAYTV